MSSKKKRNKVYKGSVAATRTTVVKVSAVKRNAVHQYWIDHKKIAKPVLIAAGVVVFIIIVIIGIVDIIW
jgi:hypothetical protein